VAPPTFAADVRFSFYGRDKMSSNLLGVQGLARLDSRAWLAISPVPMIKLLFPKAAVPCGRLHGFGFQICMPSERPPKGDDWLHQIKHDGWRVFVIVGPDGGLNVQSRNGYDMTVEFALPVKGLAAPGRPMILDGEIGVPNNDGLTHLDWLHDARTRHRPDRLAFFAFDLLYWTGSICAAARWKSGSPFSTS
jgi:hypothetical protein